MGHYSAGTTGGELMAKLREEKKSHRRAHTMARDEEREEFALSKHSYPRDRVWEWRKSEEEEEGETGSSSDQEQPFDSLLGLPRRGAAALEGRGARGRSLVRGGGRSRGQVATAGYYDTYSQSDSDSSEPPQLREQASTDSSNSSFEV